MKTLKNTKMKSHFPICNKARSIFLLRLALVVALALVASRGWGQAAASWNYSSATGNIGTTYSWIDCSTGTSITSGDNAQATVNLPFNFSFYDNNYTTANTLSVCTNGFIRFDGTATTTSTTATGYDLSLGQITLGQIVAMGVWDNKVGDGGGYVKYLTTGTAPNRIFTIEFNNIEIDYNDAKYADIEVSLYETSNKIVLKFGSENTGVNNVDMGICSGVSTYYSYWKQINGATSNTWIEYTRPLIYYSFGNTDPNDRLHWWTNTDGTGSNPTNFSTANQKFIRLDVN